MARHFFDEDKKDQQRRSNSSSSNNSDNSINLHYENDNDMQDTTEEEWIDWDVMMEDENSECDTDLFEMDAYRVEQRMPLKSGRAFVRHPTCCSPRGNKEEEFARIWRGLLQSLDEKLRHEIQHRLLGTLCELEDEHALLENILRNCAFSETVLRTVDLEVSRKHNVIKQEMKASKNGTHIVITQHEKIDKFVDLTDEDVDIELNKTKQEIGKTNEIHIADSGRNQPEKPFALPKEEVNSKLPETKQETLGTHEIHILNGEQNQPEKSADMLEEVVGRKLAITKREMRMLSDDVSIAGSDHDQTEKRGDSVEEEVNSVDEEVNSVEEDVNSVEEEVNSVEEEVNSVEEEVKNKDANGKKKKKRCGVCNKKVGLTGFECRCGGLFCGLHRYSDRHECSFDYRELGRQEIMRNNPVIGEKIKKI